MVRLPWHGFGLELMKKNTEDVSPGLTEGAGLEEVGALSGQMPSCTEINARHPTIYTGNPLLQDCEVLLALGRSLRSRKKQNKTSVHRTEVSL